MFSDHPSREELLTKFTDPDPIIRFGATVRLARLHDPQLVETFLTGLVDPDIRVREENVIALGELGDRRAVKPLLLLLHRRKSRKGRVTSLRRAIIRALGELGDPAAIAVLIQCVQRDSDWVVRGFAVEALAKIGDPRAVEPIIAALGDEEGSVVEYAIDALASLNATRAIPYLEKIAQEDRKTYGEEPLADVAQRALETLQRKTDTQLS